MIEADPRVSTPPLNSSSSNIIDLSARRASRSAAAVLPPDNIKPFEFPVTGRQRAGRKRNPLRHPCNQISYAVTVAGKLQRGEALCVDPYLDEGAILWQGVDAARLLLKELFDLAVKHGGSVKQSAPTSSTARWMRIATSSFA